MQNKCSNSRPFRILGTATTYSYVQEGDKPLITKYLSTYNEQQKASFNACLEALKGLNYYEAEKVLYGLIDAAKKQSKLS